MRPVELGPAQVVVSLKPEAGSRQERRLATLTLGQDFDTYAIELPADALGPTPDGTAIVALTVAAPPGCPGSAWRPADYPEAIGASYDERMLHVRFARAELIGAP